MPLQAPGNLAASSSSGCCRRPGGPQTGAAAVKPEDRVRPALGDGAVPALPLPPGTPDCGQSLTGVTARVTDVGPGESRRGAASAPSSSMQAYVSRQFLMEESQCKSSTANAGIPKCTAEGGTNYCRAADDATWDANGAHIRTTRRPASKS